MILVPTPILYFNTRNNKCTRGTAKYWNTATKQVSTFTIDAPQLNGTKKIWVYLPKIMPIQKKFSVIYMHDKIYLMPNIVCWRMERR
jgi:hypothetical protein